MPPHFPQSAFYDIFTLVDDHHVCVYVSLKGARDQIQLHQHEFGFMRFAFLIQSLTSSLLGFNNNDWVVLLWASMPLPPPRWFQKGFCAYFRKYTIDKRPENCTGFLLYSSRYNSNISFSISPIDIWEIHTGQHSWAISKSKQISNSLKYIYTLSLFQRKSCSDS